MSIILSTEELPWITAAHKHLNTLKFMEQLRDLAKELGTPGLDKLFKAARKKGIDISKTQVKSFLAKKGEKQIFRPLPQSKGKSGTEDLGFRAQMDIIDLKYSKSLGHKNILVLVDLYTRRVWAKPVRNKEPAVVAPVLRQILNEMDPIPTIISSDKGNEFTGAVERLLEEKEIIHRTKREKYDPNVLAVVDRAIQNLKSRLAESLADSPGEWATRIAQVVQQYNATEHSTVHDAPKEISTNPIAKYMVLQDNAQKLKHNQTILKARKTALEDAGTFRRPIGGLQQGAFRRGFKATWGDVEKVDTIQGSVVKPRGDGDKIDIKRIMPVDRETGNVEATFAQGDAWIQRKRDILFPITLELYHWLGDDEKSMSTAAAHLKVDLGEEEYRNYLRQAGFQHLSQAVSITPELALTKGGYYVRRD